MSRGTICRGGKSVIDLELVRQRNHKDEMKKPKRSSTEHKTGTMHRTPGCAGRAIGNPPE
jgi:hypothetical protein